MTIIACIRGGLGNQMFQYAMGKSLAEKHGTDLLLDIRLFKNHEMHNGFELDRVFMHCAKSASEDDIRALLGWKYYKLTMRILSFDQFAFFRGKNFYIEKGISYNQDIEILPRDCYLSGYWQSENYFKTIEHIIRSDFIFKQKLNDKNAESADQILSADSVSLHVRRGDYINNSDSVHSNCTPGYYADAINYCNARLADPVYFIFSDDIDWVRNNLEIKSRHFFINHNRGENSFHDMNLMSLCKHNIIANSSFSWWGAWLNSHGNKIVIAPEKWFNSDMFFPNDIVPDTWVTI